MLGNPPSQECKGLEILALGEITIAVLATGALFAGAPLLLVVLAFFAAHVLWIAAGMARRGYVRPTRTTRPAVR